MTETTGNQWREKAYAAAAAAAAVADVVAVAPVVDSHIVDVEPNQRAMDSRDTDPVHDSAHAVS